jgi:hypothetical protein
VRVRRIGYVSQVPWLMRGSVRDNVLLGQHYDAELMGEVSRGGDCSSSSSSRGRRGEQRGRLLC